MKWMNDWRDPGDPPLTELELQEAIRQEKELQRVLALQYKKEDDDFRAEVERLISLRKSKEAKNEDN